MNRSTTTTLLTLAAYLAVFTPLFANPTGGIVTHGNAVISENGPTFSIEQLSDKAIIHWDSFSISAGELTRFIQPGKNSAALNRVVTGNPSAIHGKLESNGKVILINPNGVLVGPTGRIEAGGGFVASTLDLPDSEFLSGGDLTFSGNSLAAVSNLGTIVAADGDVVLLSAGNVTNEGVIEAPNGVAGLATGTRVLVKSSGDERIFVQAGSADGKIDHSGTIRAAQAELKAHGSAEQLSVNVSGLIEATGVQRKGGRVLLTAGDGNVQVSGKISSRTENGDGGLVKIDSAGETRVTGVIDASSESGAGGRVEITGESVILDDAAIVNASGAGGGGEVFVGGGFQGSDPELRNAESTTIGSDVVLQANATGLANAGQVIVWADDITLFGGHVAVNAETGDAGFVEISGKDRLFYRGTVDLTSESGEFGTVLLDPENVNIIVGAAGAGANSAEIADGVVNAADGGAVDFTITTGDIAALGGNVLIEANNNIEAAAGADIVAGGDIALSAGNDVTVNNIEANGNVIVVAGNNLNFNNIDTTSSTPGDDGGDVTIFFGNQAIGNDIIANGAAGATPGQDGGDGGAVVVFNVGGGGVINFNEIQNRGGNGGTGDSANPGGSGGDGGLVSVGNDTNPSSITIPNIIYGGGDGGDGNPPGNGGQGGSLFVNNGTLTPDNTAPNGANGSNLAPTGVGGGNQNFVNENDILDLLNGNFPPDFEPPSVIPGPGFNTWLGSDVDLGGFATEVQHEAFGTSSLSDWGAQAGGNQPGASHPYGATEFGFNYGQYPQRETSIFDSETGMPLRFLYDEYCYFLYGFDDCPYFHAIIEDEPELGTFRDFLAEVAGENPALPAEDQQILFGNSVPARAPSGEVAREFPAFPRGPQINSGGKGKGKSSRGKGSKGKGGDSDDEDEIGGEFFDENEVTEDAPTNSVSAGGSGLGFRGFLLQTRAAFAPNREDELDGGGPAAVPAGEDEGGEAVGAAGSANTNRQQNRNPFRNNGNPPALNRAINDRDDAREDVADAKKNRDEAKKREDDADEAFERKKGDLEDAKKARDKKKAALDEKKKKLAEVNRMLQNLLDGAADFREDAEARQAFRDQVLRLDAEARELRGEVKEAQAAFDGADQQVAKEEAGVKNAIKNLNDQEKKVEQADREIAKAEGKLNNEQKKVEEGIKDRNRRDKEERQKQDAIRRRLLAEEKRKKAEEIAKIEKENEERRKFENRILNARQKERDKAFDNAENIDVEVNQAQIEEGGGNAAKLVQQKLIDDGKAATLEDATLGREVDNPFDSPDPRAFDSPIITELFEQKQEEVENLRFTFLNDEIDLSIREFVDSTEHIDYFQETRFNDRGDKILITQTFVNKKTGEFVTTESKHKFDDVEERPFRAINDVANEISDTFNGFKRDPDGQPDSRVIRGKVEISAGN